MTSFPSYPRSTIQSLSDSELSDKLRQDYVDYLALVSPTKEQKRDLASATISAKREFQRRYSTIDLAASNFGQRHSESITLIPTPSPTPVMGTGGFGGVTIPLGGGMGGGQKISGGSTPMSLKR